MSAEMIALADGCTPRDYAAFFVFFGTPVVILTAIIVLVAWGAKFPRVRSALCYLFAIILCLSGFVERHLLVVGMLWAIWYFGVRKGSRSGKVNAAGHTVARKENHRGSKPVWVELEIVREAPEPPDSFTVCIPRRGHYLSERTPSLAVNFTRRVKS